MTLIPVAVEKSAGRRKSTLPVGHAGATYRLTFWARKKTTLSDDAATLKV